jgi:hypothetical protein
LNAHPSAPYQQHALRRHCHLPKKEDLFASYLSYLLANGALAYLCRLIMPRSIKLDEDVLAEYGAESAGIAAALYLVRTIAVDTGQAQSISMKIAC